METQQPTTEKIDLSKEIQAARDWIGGRFDGEDHTLHIALLGKDLALGSEHPEPYSPAQILKTLLAETGGRGNLTDDQEKAVRADATMLINEYITTARRAGVSRFDILAHGGLNFVPEILGSLIRRKDSQNRS